MTSRAVANLKDLLCSETQVDKGQIDERIDTFYDESVTRQVVSDLTVEKINHVTLLT